ncbi:MAG: carbon-nitrogen hydrolase family protein [Planctomycetes bacterium]|jgi:predicted amidohydrolase|nr:carbon-nitrogen hydrolase family protein [Planctomycetota bacterium]
MLPPSYIHQPEGYRKVAIGLSCDEFSRIATRLADLKPILVFGLIESDQNDLYNTAVVVRKGMLLGRYRKTMLLKGESMFRAGSEHPVFEIDGLRFGINLCNDLNFPECARAIAEQGAELLVCPCNNLMIPANAELWKYKHQEVRRLRARETGMHLLSSDVVGAWKQRVSYGSTSLIGSDGNVRSEIDFMREGMLIWDLLS